MRSANIWAPFRCQVLSGVISDVVEQNRFVRRLAGDQGGGDPILSDAVRGCVSSWSGELVGG